MYVESDNLTLIFLANKQYLLMFYIFEKLKKEIVEGKRMKPRTVFRTLPQARMFP